jgi:hypothetical protein
VRSCSTLTRAVEFKSAVVLHVFCSSIAALVRMLLLCALIVTGGDSGTVDLTQHHEPGGGELARDDTACLFLSHFTNWFSESL